MFNSLRNLFAIKSNQNISTDETASVKMAVRELLCNIKWFVVRGLPYFNSNFTTWVKKHKLAAEVLKVAYPTEIGPIGYIKAYCEQEKVTLPENIELNVLLDTRNITLDQRRQLLRKILDQLDTMTEQIDWEVQGQLSDSDDEYEYGRQGGEKSTPFKGLLEAVGEEIGKTIESKIEEYSPPDEDEDSDYSDEQNNIKSLRIVEPHVEQRGKNIVTSTRIDEQQASRPQIAPKILPRTSSNANKPKEPENQLNALVKLLAENLNIKQQPSPVINPISIEPLKNGNQDAHEWFDTYERNTGDWTYEQRGMKLPAYLREQAVQYWRDLNETDRYDYRRIKQHLLEHFPSLNKSEVEIQFFQRTQKQGESCTEYASALCALQREYRNTSTPDAKSSLLNKFVSGLVPELRSIVRSAKCNTFEEARMIAIATEKDKLEETTKLNGNAINSVTEKKQNKVKESKLKVDDAKEEGVASVKEKPSQDKNKFKNKKNFESKKKKFYNNRFNNNKRFKWNKKRFYRNSRPNYVRQQRYQQQQQQQFQKQQFPQQHNAAVDALRIECSLCGQTGANAFYCCNKLNQNLN
jgi:hypothetical protein